jgi:hypothetical protein
MRTERPEPVLPSRDLAETREFYARIGFEAWFGGKSWPEYEIMSRGNLVVHFFACPGLDPAKTDAGCYWRVKDADRLHEALAALRLPREGIPRLTPIEDRPWGMREFSLVDPSGNLVRVGHDLGDAYVPDES